MRFARSQKPIHASIALSFCLTLTALCAAAPAHATTKAKQEKSQPAGTLLLPMTQKIDTSVHSSLESGTRRTSPAVVTSAPRSTARAESGHRNSLPSSTYHSESPLKAPIVTAAPAAAAPAATHHTHSSHPLAAHAS